MRDILLLLCFAVSTAAAPRLEFSTFFGGEFGEQANGVAVDKDGNVYLVGQTRDVPAAPGSFSSVTGQSFDVFVLKINPSGTQVLYQAVFGGGGRERGVDIAVDGAGAAYVTGWTFSEDFPVTPGAAQTVFGGGTRDAFVAKLSPDGSALEYASYLGGGAFEDGNAVVVDARGRAWVAGASGSPNFPVTPDALKGVQPADTRSAFVAAVSPDGGAFEYSTLLGGTGRDEATAATLGDGGELWITGATGSTDFPVTPGAYQTALAGVDDGFVVRLSTAGVPAITAATYLGGTECVNPFAGSPCDLPQAIFLDPEGVLIAGNTLSRDFPIAGASVQPIWGGGVAFGDAFVAKLDHDLGGLRAATFLGGSSEDQANGVIADRSGAVFLVGTTGSRNFTVTPDAVQPAFGALDEAFFVQLDPQLSEIGYSTWLGGTGGDRGYAIARAGEQRLVVAGETASREFPATAGTIKEDVTLVRSEGGDAFVAKFAFELSPRFSFSGVRNGASFDTDTLAPGEIISVFGRALTGEESASLTLGQNDRVTTELAGVRLLVNGGAAPLLFVGADQINAVVPYAVAGVQDARLQIERDGVLSNAVTLRTNDSAPALFTLTGTGGGQAAALNQDGSVNSAANPAPRGSIISLFATGEGRTDPPGVDGAVAGDILPRPVLPVSVLIGGVGAEALYAGAAPGLVAGVLQINARVPAAVIGGPETSLSFTVGFQRSPRVTIAVE